jgi:hypothetical protein
MPILGRRHLEAVLAEYVSITTPTDPTGHSANALRLRPIRRLRASAMPTTPGYDEATDSAGSSTSNGWSPELGGWGSRHPQVTVGRLRRKLGEPQAIETKAGLGYRISGDDCGDLRIGTSGGPLRAGPRRLVGLGARDHQGAVLVHLVPPSRDLASAKLRIPLPSQATGDLAGAR